MNSSLLVKWTSVKRGFFVLAVLLLAGLSNCAIIKTSFDSGGEGYTTLIDAFGVAAGAQFTFDVVINSDHTDPNHVSFIIVVGKKAVDNWFSLQFQDPRAIDWSMVCLAPSAARFELNESGTYTATANIADQYTSYLLVCQADSRVMIDVTATVLNLDIAGNLSQQLPIEDATLPMLYAVSLAVWLLLTALWSGELHRSRLFVLRIHLIFLLVLVLKIALTAITAAYWAVYREEGVEDPILRDMTLIAYKLEQVVFVLSLTLLGLGLDYTRPNLGRKESQILLAAFGSYLVLGVSQTFCSAGSGVCTVGLLLEYIVRSLIMLGTVVAVNYIITSMRASLHVPWTSTMALEYLKLRQYIVFRNIYICFLLLPTAVMFVRYLLLPWEFEWMTLAMEEFFTLIIYVHLGVTFAPFNNAFISRAFEQRGE